MMLPISDMPDGDFMKLQAAYNDELPMCPICMLEDVRHALSVFEVPKDAVSEGVHHTLEDLLFIVTGALVTNRAEAEEKKQAPH